MALVTVTLSDGGAERCAALLSNYFENNNIEVHHIVFSGKIEYDFSGKLYHLIDNKSNNSKLNRLFKLRNYLKNNQFDFIIDFRVKRFQIMEYIISRFVYNTKQIATIHNFMTNLYFPKNKFLANSIYKNAKIITVANAITDKVNDLYKYNDVETIYNPIDCDYFDEKSKEVLKLDFKYILAVGRFTTIKQFEVTINAYNQSVLKENNIKLILLGNGEQLNFLENVVKDLKLENDVLFYGFQDNPYKFMKNALFLVLASKYEGFPMVLIECLATGTPVVSYNCPSGPAEIIKNNENGILVENQNPLALTNALNEMVTNKELYLHCKQNAKTSVEPFSIDKIGSQWLELFKQLKNEC